MKILFVTLSNLGDVVLTLPVLQSLRKKYPEASFDVIVGVSGAIVFKDDTRLRKWTLYDKKAPLSEKFRFLKEIRRERYDIIVDLRHSLLGLLGGARKRNSYLLKLSRGGHRGLKHLSALEGLAPVYPGESYLESRQNQPLSLPEGRYVVAAPGSKSDTKKWPSEKFAALLARLSREKNYSVVLVGDKNDAKEAEEIRKLMDKVSVLDFSGKTDFTGLVQVVRNASLVITNDSAPLHIADSLGVPVLALFGPSDPKKYGPRQAGSLAVSKKLFCQPCEKAQCRYNLECLKELEVSEVYGRALRILDGKVGAQSPRILVIRLDRIGDLMLSLPAIEALRRRFPGSFISVMTRPATKLLLEGQPAVDEVIAYDYSKKGRHAFPFGYFHFIEEIMKRRFDAAIILHPGVRSYLVPFLAAIPNRIGYRNKHAWLLTKALKDERRLGQKHESQYAVDLAAVLSGVHESAPPPPKLLSDASLADGFPQGRFLAVHPGASCVSKRWPAGRFRDLVEKFLKEFPDHRAVVIGGLETRGEARLIASGNGERVLDFAGKLDLKQLPALLSRCDALVSNDSGPVHIAAAVGIPVVSLFGRNKEGLNAARWRPLGEGHAVIQKDVGCQVCLAHECPIEFECLKAIEVDDVLKEVRKILTAAFIFLFISLPVQAANDFSAKQTEQHSFVEPAPDIPMGEHLFYAVSWMGVPVGLGELWVKEKAMFEGHEAYHVVAVAATNDFLSKIYPVRDEVHSWIDAKTFQSLGSQKKASEGFYRADERVVYDENLKIGHYESLKSSEKKDFIISVPVHDPVSAFYWARRQPLTPGKSLKTVVNNGEKDYSLEVNVLRFEAVELRGKGVQDTILIEPKTRLEGLLEKRGRVWVRLKTDAYRTPLTVTFRTPFGPIVGVLKEEASA